MSRAFVKESDDAVDVGPVRPHSPHTNYVTPRGLQLLQQKVQDLARARSAIIGRDDLASVQRRRELERDLLYYNERLQRAVPVDPALQPLDKVHFGAAVTVEDAEGLQHEFILVGEDEADAAQGRISWVSPLAKALINARVGDVVSWRRPVGDMELEVLAIRRA